MKYIDKIALLYIKEHRILSSRSKGKDVYYLPGGKREMNESDIETLVREIKEELSTDICVDSVKYYGTFSAQAHGHDEGVMVQMTCYMAEFNNEPKASHEIEEIRWLRYEDKDCSSEVDQLIFDDLHERGYL